MPSLCWIQTGLFQAGTPALSGSKAIRPPRLSVSIFRDFTSKRIGTQAFRLVLVPRETPLSVIHLENLTALARAGATIVPAMPAFYNKPETLADAVDTVVARVLDHVHVSHAIGKRWGTKS